MMNIERLQILATFLETFPEDQVKNNKFNLTTWMCSNEHASKHFEDKPGIMTSPEPFKVIDEELKIVEPNFCQTVGCAMGWAATIPEFKDVGLHLRFDPDILETADVCFRDHYGFRAINEFFKFKGFWTGDMLFSPASYRSDELTDPLAVAKRIRYLVRVGEDHFKETYLLKYR